MNRFIVVEGLIGVGKSSLCRLLAEEWDATLVLEPAETNPFLKCFYEDPPRFAFPVQMFYLIMRWRQQDQVRQQDLFDSYVVSDYLFAKDRLFAEKTLEPLELDLYDRFARALGEQAPTPDLLIWLEAPTETLMKRIKRRRAPGEEAITRDYLEDLRARYKVLLSNWTASPVLSIDNTNINYVDDPAGREQVLRLIEAALFEEPGSDAPGFDKNREAQPGLFATEA